MGVLGAGLAAWSRYTAHRDVEIATGPVSAQQERFLIDAADRPDIETFFKSLSPSQRIAMARNIGRYRDPKLADLCGKLLGSFDPEARSELTNSLSAIARAEPDSVAAQLSLSGSFQVVGVQQALDSARPASLGAVAKQLESGPARQNAEGYLVHVGAASVPYLLPVLSSSDEPTRLAAEVAMGKLHSRKAVPFLDKAFRTGSPEEREIALIALASIADPSSERILCGVISDSKSPAAWRCEAALGLGRIATPSGAAALWKYATDPDWTLSEACFNALQTCGDAAVESAPSRTDPRLVLRVAREAPGSAADRLIEHALTDKGLRIDAARAAAGRRQLVPALAGSLSDPLNVGDGDYAEAAIGSLETTREGRNALRSNALSRTPALAGFVHRARLAIH